MIENDETLMRWKWQFIKQSGYKPTPPRSGLCCASVPNTTKAFFFGGVQVRWKLNKREPTQQQSSEKLFCFSQDIEDDDDDDDEEATGQFFNDLFSLQVDNDKGVWQKGIIYS